MAMEWELSKENVQPLRRGRKNLALLSESLNSESPHALNEQRRIFLENIDKYSGDDPLEPWLRCIEWTKEAYPSGGAQSGILQMLELCLRTLCSNDKYKDDPRYLKLWMDYADRCHDPSDIFKFLESNDIGQTQALFYDSYASYLERCKSYSKANDVYQLGISRLSDSDELKLKYRGFVERAAKRSRDDEDVSTEDAIVRSFGGMKVQQSAPRVGLRRPMSTKDAISVFVDEDLRPGPSPRFESEMWSHLGTQAERNKENVQMASKWTKAKPKPSSTSSRTVAARPPAPTIDIFVDDEFLGKGPRKRTPAAASLLRFRPDDKPDAETIRQVPLRNFQTDYR